VTPRRIGLVAKRGLAAAAPHLVKVGGWLEARGVVPVVDIDTAALDGLAGYESCSREELPRRVDLLLVLGGDGTLLGMAGRVGAAGVGIPIIGVNFGRLGFLTEITLEELFPALEAALEGRAQIHERRLLRARTIADGVERDSHLALNDVVVTRGAISRVVELAISVDGDFVTRVKGDGVILASPTGPTISPPRGPSCIQTSTRSCSPRLRRTRSPTGQSSFPERPPSTSRRSPIHAGSRCLRPSTARPGTCSILGMSSASPGRTSPFASSAPPRAATSTLSGRNSAGGNGSTRYCTKHHAPHEARGTQHRTRHAAPGTKHGSLDSKTSV
jgi:hypothetical protein